MHRLYIEKRLLLFLQKRNKLALSNDSLKNPKVAKTKKNPVEKAMNIDAITFFKVSSDYREK
ncbi:hypothetical protein ONA22_02595 [Mycoplasmopsis cynos]|uniref:hypothetical protein n=1 Tax=Mycoplasmopsis cynos TaxID=171284 RepID=UPI0024C86971|nr:hypothetical protein [Mycoplasmopsis cynos]WAM03883.1 hypothetical protein ONA22_02595 [Mycoplasmopsis cynos]